MNCNIQISSYGVKYAVYTAEQAVAEANGLSIEDGLHHLLQCKAAPGSAAVVAKTLSWALARLALLEELVADLEYENTH